MLRNRPEPWDTAYGPLSEFIFYRTYSRDGERWWQVITRVIEGTFSIRKNHFVSEGLPWDEEQMQHLAWEMALTAFDGHWGPPGRGYWAMGVEELIYAKGGMALNNCGFVDVKDLGRDVHWAMDGLMMGVGVGFSTWNDVLTGIQAPREYPQMKHVEVPEDDVVNGTPFSKSYHVAKEAWGQSAGISYVIPDSREGWCDSTRLLIDSYYGGPEMRFNYSRIRPRGTKIKGFGGEASGPWPLRKLHRQIRALLDNVVAHPDNWTSSRLITDIINMCGCCIVAGNVRRSATIALGHPDDTEFGEMKHYADWDENGVPEKTKYWYRRRFGWMSNNSYVLSETEHFSKTIPLIADGIKRNGEPGFYNLKAVKAFGRLGDRVGTSLSNGTQLREDHAVGINPCGEVPLESYELCCLAEWYPTRCLTDDKIDHTKALKAVEHAAFYTQTVQLLMTHRPETNEVIQRNRRTGVSLAGAAALREITTMTDAIALMEEAYDVVRRENKRASEEAQVPEAIRVTAEKPSGTSSLLWGVPAGAHWPMSAYLRKAIRVDNGRMRLREVADRANVPHEPDLVSANTEVYYFPLKTPGADSVRPAHEVSMWEKADFAVTLAQHFIDNAVSVTVNFDPMTKEQQLDATQVILASIHELDHKITDLQSRIDHETIMRTKVGYPHLMTSWDDRPEWQTQMYDLQHEKDGLLENLLEIQRRNPEGDDVERLVASYVGKLKSMSMMPTSGHGYAQAPETPITQAQWQEMLDGIGEYDWSSFTDQGVEEVFCASCEVV
jgi:ribonucleoside-diphosphate reductase alpha chain